MLPGCRFLGNFLSGRGKSISSLSNLRTHVNSDPSFSTSEFVTKQLQYFYKNLAMKHFLPMNSTEWNRTTVHKLWQCCAIACLFVMTSISLQAQQVNLLLWRPNVCVDNVGTPCGNEGPLVLAALNSCNGNAMVEEVITSTALNAADLANDILTNDIDMVVIPETENCNINVEFTPAMKAVLAQHVLGGGGLIYMESIASAGLNEAPNFLNSTFGYSLGGQGTLLGAQFSTLNAGQAAGTGFDGGPAILPNINSDLTISGPFPPATKNIYENLFTPGDDNSVFVSRYGSGEVAFVGYDFFACGVPFPARQAWIDVLCRTVAEVGPNGLGCILPDIPNAWAEEDIICDGDFTKVGVTGELRDAANWFWYDDVCGGNLVGIGNVIQVAPTTTTTYYVRGEGGCVLSSGPCASVTVEVSPVTQPLDFDVLGGTMNVSCDNNNDGLEICLSGSQLNFTYELFRDEMVTGITAPGTGNPICFPPVFAPGEYRVIAYNNDSPQPPLCFDRMPGIAVLNVADSPIAYNTTINECPDAFDSNNADFDLTTADAAVTGGEPGLTVSYYISFQELEAGVNALTSPYNSPTGNVWAKVEDEFGCFASSLVQLVVEESPTILAYGTGESCDGEDDGSATVEVLSGPAPYTYTWDNGGNTATINDLSPGTYWVTVLDGNGCSQRASVDIIGAAPIVIDDVTWTNPTCAGASDGSIDLTVSGGSNGVMYDWDNGAQDIADPNGLAAGTYTVVITDGNGCTETTQVTLTDPATLEVDITDVTNADCAGAETGSATANASGGTPPYTISWSNGQSESGVMSLTATELHAGDHIVTVTDANGCEVTQGVAISDPNGLVVNMENVEDARCFGTLTGKATAIADLGTPPYEYDFDFNGPGFTDNQFQNMLPAGLHKVRVRDANGCIAETFFMIGEPDPLVFMEWDITDETCDGANDGSITVLAQGGTTPYTYVWLGLGVVGNTADDLAPGDYTVRVQDGNGCSEQLILTVGAGPSLEIAEIPDIEVCPEGDVYDILLNSTPGNLDTEYSWTGGASVGLSDGNTTGVNPFIPGFTASMTEGSATVTVTATLAGGCVDTEEFTITVDDNDLTPGFYGCPDDIIVGNDPDVCGAYVNWQDPVALDECGFVTVTQTSGDASGTFFPVGTSAPIIYTADDGNGNTSTCEFTVTVRDTEIPEIACPFQFLNQDTDAEVCDYTVNGDFLDATASDNCSISSLSNDYNMSSTLDGETFAKGAHVIVWTAEDAAGNKMTCSYTLTVSDNEDPTVMTCPNNETVNTDADACSAIVDYDDPTFDDNCDGMDLAGTLVNGLASGSAFPVGTTTVTWEYVDNAGNGPAICTFTVTVNDNENPEITCPDNVVVDTDGNVSEGSATVVSTGPCGVTLSYTQPVGTDNCMSNTYLTGGQGGAPNYYQYGGTYTESYQVVDASGNTDECSFTITVEDQDAPAISCPEDLVVDTDAGVCEAVVVYANPVGFDNCPGFTITLTEGLTSGSSFPEGETTVEYTITDDMGTETSCSFTVTVEDNEAPSLTCPPDRDVFTSSGILGDCKAEIPDLIAELIATDNCTDFDDLIIVQQPQAGANFNGDHLDTKDVTITVIDEEGNISTCVVVLTLIDDENPTIDCSMYPAVFSADPGECGYTVTDDSLDPEIDDNCAKTKRHDFFFAPQLGTLEGATFPVGVTEVTWIVKDAANNFDMCTVTVTVTDDELPMFENCPPDVTINADVDKCGANYNWADPVVSDNCGVDGLMQTGGMVSGSFFSVGTHTISYQATDENNNTNTCSFDITVNDMQIPEISCPFQFLTQSADENCEWVVDGDLLDATAWDNCSIDDLTNDYNDGETLDGETFPLGATTVTWTAEDPSGNSISCSYIVTVVDDSAPTVATCPQDIVVDNDFDECGAVVDYADPTFDDNCDGDGLSGMMTGGLASGSEFPVGVTVVTFEYTDAAGNGPAVCSFTVTVEDTQAPIIVCPEDVIVGTDGAVTSGIADVVSTGPCGVTLSYTAPVGTDNCPDPLTVLAGGQGDAPNYYLYGGTYTEVWSVSDASGNFATCDFTITVEDPEPPVITCPVSFTVDNDPGDCGAVVNYSYPIDGDNCPGWTTTQTDGPPSGSFFDVGITTVGFSITDDMGNSTSCSFEVTVEDTEAPVINDCGDDQEVVADADCMGTIPDLTGGVDAEDNCTDVDDLIITQEPAAGELFGGAHGDTQVVTITVEDEEGNSSTCEVVLTLVDETAPTIDCSQIVTDRNADPGECSFTMPGAGFDPTFDDNCDANIYHDYAPAPNNNTLAGATFPVGSTDVTWTVEDENGNTATCDITITITDDEDPVFVNCPDQMIMIGNDPDQCSGKVNWPIPVATDNCGIESVIQTAGPLSGTAVDVCDLQTVTYEATDESGNTETCSFDVLVIDTQSPEFDADIVMPGDITVECDAIPDPFVLTNDDVNDNCTDPDDLDIDFDETDTQDPDPAVCEHYNYTITRTWTVTDEECADGGGANELVHVQIIDVEDTTPPMAVCMDVTLTLDIFGNVTLDPAQIDGGSTDNCAPANVLDLMASQTEFDCDDLGDNVITLTVTDPCGNFSTCTAIVTVVEGIAPCVPEYDVDGSDPCVCLNNATTLFDGQFGEVIQIEALAGQTWTLLSSNGFFSTGSQNPPLAPTPIPNGVTLIVGDTDGVDNDGNGMIDEFNEKRFYIIEGRHVDAIGYTANLQNNLGDNLSIENTCYYPTPEFLNIAGPYCFSTVPFEIEVGEVNGADFTIVDILIDGVSQNVFDPVALGGGAHTIVAIIDAGEASPYTLVNGVQIGGSDQDALEDPGCEQAIEVTVDVIETPAVIACNDLVQVSINGDCVSEITADMVLEGSYYCYDDYTVILNYPPFTNTYNPPNQVDGSHAGMTLQYTLEHLISGNICWGEVLVEDKLAPEITCPDDVEILCTQDPDNLLITGTPTVIDCSDWDTEYSDEYEQFDCEDDAGVSVVITRTWIATDEWGNTSTCIQTITVKRGELSDIVEPADIDYDCNNLPADFLPGNTGWPTVGGFPITDQGSGACGLGVSYDDDIVNTCPGSYKIVRTWTLYDWCPPGGGDPVNVSFVQYIKIEDVAPTVTLPTNGYDPVNDWYVISANGYAQPPHDECVAIGPLPLADVDGVCNEIVSIQISTTAGNTNNGGMIPGEGLPQGIHQITYIAEDECGNITNHTVTINVVDNVAPVTICDEITDVDLTSDGTAEVFATTFDDGSYDNCCLDELLVRRMDGDCDGNFDEFDPSVIFCCSDVGADPVMVVFRAIDCEGNYNDCMVTVEVGDKLPPVLVNCPEDVTITCDEYFEELDAAIQAGDFSLLDNYGVDPTFFDNCDLDIEYTVTPNVDQCGDGTITREWEATDPSGNFPAICTQVITVEHVSDWVVEFPDDIDAVCTDGELPEFGEPAIFHDECELIGVSYEDAYFYVVPDACYKIERTWTAINWCIFEDYGYDVWEEDGFAECDLFQDWDGDGDRDCRTFRDGWNESGTPGTPDGYIDYKQIIKVVDVDEPTFEIPEIDGCIVEIDCDKDLVIPYPNITDACSPDFEVDITGSFGVFNDIQGDITIDDVVPGTYNIYYTVTDNCGNQAYDDVTVVVEDCKKPTPYCKNGIIVEIMQTGMVDVWASDLNDGSFDNCPGDLQFSFSSDVNNIGTTYTCDDLGPNEVEVWVTDATGNQDFCVTTIFIQDNMFSCNSITVAGVIETEEVEPVEDVTVEVNGGLFVETTDNTGAYDFTLASGGDFSITPMHDVNPLNGVTTYDLVLITQHILNINPLDSPYKIIAADANNSQSVTTLDLVAIQKLILNVEPTFPNNTSWRFVDAAYVFPQANNPWAQIFPEIVNYNNLGVSVLDADFIAVKIGDVNSSAQTNSAMIPQDRTVGNLVFQTEQVDLKAGDRYTVEFTAADQSILGYQFTMNFNTDELKVVGIGEGLATEDNFGFAKLTDGALTTSWHEAEGRTFAADEVVFSVVIEALKDINLADAFTVNSRYTTEEAYNVAGEHLNVELVFGTETGASFGLYQNVPNPFRGSTTIGFNLPEATQVTLQIMDVSGKVLRTVQGDYDHGYNEIIVKDLDVTGVLYYKVSTSTHTATKKMIVTK